MGAECLSSKRKKLKMKSQRATKQDDASGVPCRYEHLSYALTQFFV